MAKFELCNQKNQMDNTELVIQIKDIHKGMIIYFPWSGRIVKMFDEPITEMYQGWSVLNHKSSFLGLQNSWKVVWET